MEGDHVPERIDYIGYQNAGAVFVLAVEKMLAIEVPEKATWMRMLLFKLNRIHSHLIYLGTSALRARSDSRCSGTPREREMILDLSEMVAGTRMHTRYFQVGGLAEDIPPGFYPHAARSSNRCRTRSTTISRCSTGTRTGSSGRRASASSRPTTRSRSASPGRTSARPASTGSPPRQSVSRLRRGRLPRAGVRDGDVYDRYRVRMDEMAKVDAHRAPVPRPARADGTITPGSQTIARSCAAARGAPHVDRARSSTTSRSSQRATAFPRRDVHRDRIAARRVRLLRRLGRRAAAVARALPRAVVRRARGDGDLRARVARRRPDRDRRLARRGDGDTDR